MGARDRAEEARLGGSGAVGQALGAAAVRKGGPDRPKPMTTVTSDELERLMLVAKLKDLTARREELEAVVFDLTSRNVALRKANTLALDAMVAAERGRMASFYEGVEAVAKVIESHSRISSCCDAHPHPREANELAKCVRRVKRPGP